MTEREKIRRLADALSPERKRAVVIVMTEDGLSDASETVRFALKYAAAARPADLRRFKKTTN